MGLRLELVSELCSPISSSLEGLISFSGQRFPYKSSGHGILDKQILDKQKFIGFPGSHRPTVRGGKLK